MSKIYIRRLEKKDYGLVHALAESTNDHPFFPLEPSRFEKDAYFFLINRMNTVKKEIHGGVFDCNALIGIVSLHDIDSEKRSGEYSIYLKPAYHHRGVAAEATTFILKEAFETFSLGLVYLRVDSGNEAAIRFYERFGFERTASDVDGADDFLWYRITADKLQ